MSPQPTGNDAAGFAAAINAWSQKVDLALDEAVRRIALRVWEELVARTPIDTGRAQAGWVTNLDEPSDHVPPGIAASALAQRQGQRRAGETPGRIVPPPQPPDLSAATARNRIFIVNNVLYAVELDHGSSRQAPAGIVAVTMAQVRAELEEIIAEHGG